MANEEKRERGLVRVTFDAGSNGLSVNQNPVEARRVEKGRRQIAWELKVINGNQNCKARLTNIVLCDFNDRWRLTEDGQLDAERSDDRWTWTFTAAGKEGLEVHYDIFCTYGPENSATRTLSLRQSASVDPTVLTPPNPIGD